MNVRYRVTLSTSERVQLVTMVLGGKAAVRKLKRSPDPDKPTLIAEVAQWEQRRNRERARIEWLFTIERAREKLGRVYPKPSAGITRRRQRTAA